MTERYSKDELVMVKYNSKWERGRIIAPPDYSIPVSLFFVMVFVEDNITLLKYPYPSLSADDEVIKLSKFVSKTDFDDFSKIISL